jgi:thioredoxin reductase (NADPH)
VVRGTTLAESASDYLITQLDGLPNVTVHLDSEVVDAADEQRLRSISLRNRASGDVVEKAVSGLFIMIGAVPRTDWLPPDVARDDIGFMLTGEDGPHVDRPDQFRLPFETTMPGVFALGDVRSGSVKRIAAAVGEGSAAVQQVHRYLERVAAASAAERERAIGEPIPIGTMHAEIAAAARK